MMPQDIMADPNWECPKCLNICGCRYCRKKPGNKAYIPNGTRLGHNTKAFADLTIEQRFEICKALEAEQRPFFDLVLAHTMQGFYGNPRHGGNREYASWRMLGVTPTQVRGRNLYELRPVREAT